MEFDSLQGSDNCGLLCESMMDEFVMESGHLICTNRYQVLNDLNKFGQDKYLGAILKQKRLARANQSYYIVNLLDQSITDQDISRPQDQEVLKSKLIMLPQIQNVTHTQPSTSELVKYLDNYLNPFGCQNDMIKEKYGRKVIFAKLGHQWDVSTDELFIWTLSRKQLSPNFNGDADDMIYYYLTWNADINDYFYASYKPLRLLKY